MPFSFSIKKKEDSSANDKRLENDVQKSVFSAFTTSTTQSEKPVKEEVKHVTKRRRLDAKIPDVDSSIYDFDGWKQSDEAKIQKPRRGRRLSAKRKYGVVYEGGERGQGGEKAKPKSRYVEKLLVKANARQREQDIAREKAKQRELEAEIAEHGKTETFVTGAYKKKLQEDKIWLEKLEDERRLQEERDRKDRQSDSRGDMTSFYRNLLTRNVALGGEDNDETSSSPPHPPSSSTLSQNIVKNVLRGDAHYNKTEVERNSKDVDVERNAVEKSEIGSVKKNDIKKDDRAAVVMEPPSSKETTSGNQKNNEKKISKEERIAAARARYLARRKGGR